MSAERQGCAERRDDLAAYALGALTADEAVAFERHLEGCDACRAELRWLMPAVDLIPVSVEQVAPPESLRESLMATVRAEAAAAEPATATALGPERVREPWWHGLRSLMMRPAVGMAALILLIAGVGAGWLLRGPDTVEPGTNVVRAEPVGTATPVSATLERTGDTGTLHVQALPPIRNDEVYEIWVQRAGVMEPSNTFVLSGDGSAEAAIPGPLSGGQAIYVTREPRGGSPQPTTRPVLQAPL
jgi:anti-sigma-K factor RskA